MTRYTITVPVFDNEGARLNEVLTSVRERLTEDIGGFTEHEGIGGWRDDFRTYTEFVKVFTVDTDAVGGWDYIHELARSVKIQARQESVYITRQEIETALV